jgi:hypothetical protein
MHGRWLVSHEEGAAAAAEFMLRFATSEFKGVVGFSRGLRSYHHAPLYIFVSDKESECLVEKSIYANNETTE